MSRWVNMWAMSCNDSYARPGLGSNKKEPANVPSSNPQGLRPGLQSAAPPGLKAELTLRTRVDPRVGAVGPDFLFPDGGLGLQRVDPPAAGVEGVGAVRGGDGNEDRRLAERDAARAVQQRQPDHR